MKSHTLFSRINSFDRHCSASTWNKDMKSYLLCFLSPTFPNLNGLSGLDFQQHIKSAAYSS